MDVLNGWHRRGALPPIVVAVLWVGGVFNLPVFRRRLADEYAWADPVLAAWGLGSEVALVLGFAALVFGLGALLGRWGARVLGGLLILVSAACAYYMTFFNVIIGFGVVQATLHSDHELSSEVLGAGLLAWCLLLGLGPAVWWWRRVPPCWWRQPRRRVALGRLLAGLLLAVLMFVLAGRSLATVERHLHPDDGGQRPGVAGVAAHAYVPSNWMAGVGMLASRAWVARQLERELVDPAQRHTYVPGASLDELLVVLVIGETARYDRFGLLGHHRDTTPHLAAEPDLVALAARSCDTATQLSLACMFVRPASVRPGEGLQPDTVTEHGVFSVYRRLGFRIDLFAMQGEAGFYNRTGADAYKLREMIAAQPENAGREVDDMLLVPELARAVAQHRAARGAQPQLVILHTKGSHYQYSQRYPRSFARWGPECLHTHAACSSEELFNAFDNSVLYTDQVLKSVRDTVRDRRALVIYVPDHGESIDERTHFHATPRRLAPREQFMVPLVFWATGRFLADPALAQPYRQLQARAAQLAPDQAGHHNLFASMLGCIGVRSPDGGIPAADDLCDRAPVRPGRLAVTP